MFVFFSDDYIIFFSYSEFHKQKFFENEINKMSYKVRVIGSKIGLDRFNDTSQTESIISDLIELSSPNESSNIFFLWPEGILTNTYQDELYKFSEIFSKNFSENHLIGLGMTNRSFLKKITNILILFLYLIMN